MTKLTPLQGLSQVELQTAGDTITIATGTVSSKECSFPFVMQRSNKMQITNSLECK